MKLKRLANVVNVKKTKNKKQFKTNVTLTLVLKKLNLNFQNKKK